MRASHGRSFLCRLTASVAFALAPFTLVAAQRPHSAAAPAPALHTANGTEDISRIHLTAVYYLPPGRLPCPEWRERIGYLLDRMARFHAREFAGQSRLTYELDDRIFVPETNERPKDGDDWLGVVDRVRQRVDAGFLPWLPHPRRLHRRERLPRLRPR